MIGYIENNNNNKLYNNILKNIQSNVNNKGLTPAYVRSFWLLWSKDIYIYKLYNREEKTN